MTNLPRRADLPELPLRWECPACGTPVDMSAEKSNWLHVCQTCLRYAVDWERSTRMLRVIGPTENPLPRWGW